MTKGEENIVLFERDELFTQIEALQFENEQYQERLKEIETTATAIIRDKTEPDKVLIMAKDIITTSGSVGEKMTKPLLHKYIELRKVNEKFQAQIDNLKYEVVAREKEIKAQQQDIDKLQQWVNDLQAGMYVNCVYCGHRYGMENDTPVAMADVLKGHIEHCPKHPMSKLKKEIEWLKKVAQDLYFAYANKDPDCPHSFEAKTIEKYKKMLGGKENE